MAEKTDNRPVKSLRSRGIEVAIWLKTVNDRDHYSITVKRSYKVTKDGQDEWKDTGFFDSEEAPILAALITRAYQWTAFQLEATNK